MLALRKDEGISALLTRIYHESLEDVSGISLWTELQARATVHDLKKPVHTRILLCRNLANSMPVKTDVEFQEMSLLTWIPNQIHARFREHRLELILKPIRLGPLETHPI
jgi:hypothetical protein